MTRTDDDTWDPATGVGMTATFGAAARAVGTNKGLINDPFAEQLVRAAGVDYFIRVIEDQRYADPRAVVTPSSPGSSISLRYMRDSWTNTSPKPGGRASAKW